ncbi:hypothetical protein LEP1GSC173_1982 [Leptospira interrogans str. HAI1594]|uniref:Uncharacterized protein n=4 Tax=Leptospira interrogans TaxID=173 RepID=A0A0F6HDC9_LEPIR|nr:hypothetical protein G436_3123 [Leptospira interrogans serovar Hardjo str. Norma]EJP04468.1 hypothetical protein LEP1GSC007_2495 [Leptospira interrogans serovar Bulgarica str. Mallika]EKO26324.1 hypothetical protein LEP1GSC104_3018 [Leptospira interrogans str. UI 12621]EKO98146.1 hypothetical protein LEP1GSC057_3386 [Leptospira interrogans str. Brem 329]EKP20522.1 hypothetical protein LEP1GSC117_2315 [Leptospira interrogans serovar Icterohaemorrhagiae str. Verdun LP]EKP74686.1 hypothetical 
MGTLTNLYFKVNSTMVHFFEKSWNLNFTDRFLKCGNSHKSRLHEQILKL